MSSNTPGSFPSSPSPSPAGPPRKKRSRRRLWLYIAGGLVGLFVILGVIGAIIGPPPSSAPKSTSTHPVAQQQSSPVSHPTRVTQPTQATQPTQVAQPTPVPTTPPSPTQIPTPTPTPSTSGTPLPSAADLSQLLSPAEGTVTDVSAPTTNSNGTKNVAVDIQVNNPTQTRIKHICLELAQYFFQRSDIGVVNFVFHANGYTGVNDPIADSGGVAPNDWVAMDEDQLWTALAGVFEVNLPA